MRGLPHAARIIESAAAEAQSGKPALSRMPHLYRGFSGAGNSFIPQPGAEISGVHAVPCGNSWLEFRSFLVQTLEEEGEENGSHKSFLLRTAAPGLRLA